MSVQDNKIQINELLINSWQEEDLSKGISTMSLTTTKKNSRHIQGFEDIIKRGRRLFQTRNKFQ